MSLLSLMDDDTVFDKIKFDIKPTGEGPQSSMKVE